MTPEQIIENNILLAEFMGVDYFEIEISAKSDLYERGFRNPEYINNPLMWTCFHNDWNWLMGIVDKIESLEGCEVILSKYLIEIYKGNLRKSCSKITTSKIEATYNVCVEFVEWYNRNKGEN